MIVLCIKYTVPSSSLAVLLYKESSWVGEMWTTKVWGFWEGTMLCLSATENKRVWVVLLFLSTCMGSAGTVEREAFDAKAKESF